MIPRKSEHTLEVQGNVSTKKMTIAANAVAFRALIDGMYADKIGSIMRELWTNAWDAQVEAGLTDKPFEVRLPTSLNPSFHVRDFGVSMPHDIVMEVFTTMFESTKRESNAVAGKFGVGSKSPFAYTDAYTVTCFLDGEVRIYSVHIGSDGSPEVALMQRGETEEPNGLMVAFPVEKEDFKAFYRAASRTSLGFDVKPTINLGEEVFEDLPEVEMENANWKLYKKADYRIGIRVKMGCVTYPVDREFLSGEMFNNVGSANMVVEVPIGACDVNLSREALSYDDETVVNLTAAFIEAVQSIEEYVAKSLKDAESYRELCARYLAAQEILQKFGINSKTLPLTFNGLPASDTTWIPENWVESEASVGMRYMVNTQRPTLYLARRSRYEWRAKSLNSSLAYSSKCLYVITLATESTPYLGDRVKQYIEDNRDALNNVAQIVRLEINHNMIICKETLRMMLLDIPEKQIVLAQDLKLDRKRIPNPEKTEFGTYHYMVGGSYRLSSNVRNDIDCYVLTAGAHTPDAKEYGKLLSRNYQDILSNLRNLGWSPVVIHLPKKDRARKDELDLPDFFTVARKKMKSACGEIDPAFMQAYEDVAVAYGGERKYRQIHTTLNGWQSEFDVLQYIDENSSARPLMEIVADRRTTEDRMAAEFSSHRAAIAIRNLIAAFGEAESITGSIREHREKLINVFEKFSSDYPMVSFIREPTKHDTDAWAQAEFLEYLNSK